jgi:4a-hydroxytetrahydrobiopterin dehydratase
MTRSRGDEAMPTLLAAPLVDETLEALPGWNQGEGEIWREILLPDELDAVLRHQVEVDATAMNHAPDMIRVPGGTRFSLRTHEVGGVSELDVALASHISDLAHRLTQAAPDVPDEPGVEAVRQDDADIVIGSTDPMELETQPERVGKFQVRF